MRRFAFLLLPLTLLCSPAFAQEDASALAERLERLERDVSFVQKQVYRGGGSESGAGVPVNNGQAQVRFSQIDEEMRQIRGLIEQVQFQNKQTATELKKLSEDMDYRLRALEQKQTVAAEPPPVSPPAPLTDAAADDDTPAAEASKEEKKPANYKPEGKEKPALTGNDFPNANAHYSHAFKLLNEKKFAEAAASFDTFVKKYPSDPLTSNAFYWLGESQYIRKDYTRSAESFRKGFETNTDGQKAPDNLYKLAMSLSQVKRTSEACIVLGRVIEKYSETAARTAIKAQEARTNLQCK